MKYKAIFFDLDGTLLDSLGDIVLAVNASLKECGYEKQYTYDEGKKLIGSGSYNLSKRALSFKQYTSEEYEHFIDVFFSFYRVYQERTTSPFNGIMDLLFDLKKEGYLIFIASNKPQEMLEKVVPIKFPGFKFDYALGQCPGCKEKPDPYVVNQIKEKFSLKDSECLYIGDSYVDIDTAKNANIDVCLVTYGYGDYTDELKKRATFVAQSVNELRSLLIR